MLQTTKNSHYIARTLSRGWELKYKGNDRHLWFYDFDRDVFDVRTSKRLFTLSEPYPQKVEDFLARIVEDPLARFLARFHLDRDAQPAWPEFRALSLALMLQALRNGADEDLEKLESAGEAYLDQLVQASTSKFEVIYFPLQGPQLFYPSTGMIPLPFIGGLAGWAIPLRPSYMAAFVPVPHEPCMQQLTQMRARAPELFTALSVGLDPCRRVVIPGSWLGKVEEDDLRRQIHAAREVSRNLCSEIFTRNRRKYGSSMPGFERPGGTSLIFPGDAEWNG